MELFKLFGTIAVDNSEANKQIDDTSGRAKKAQGTMSGAFSKIGTAAKSVAKGAAVMGAGFVGAVGSIIGLSSATQEYTEDMGKLTTAFETNGKTTEQAKSTYQGFVGLLGETDTAVEASNHLAQLCTSQEELSQWTTIAAGVYGTFGDSLPLEGLTEAANETAKCGTVTGSFADALNWTSASVSQFSAGLSGHSAAQAAFNQAISEGATKEDAFNAALAACNTEQERAQIVTSTMTQLYGEAGAKYQEVNKDLIAARQAQSDWNGAMAEAGQAVQPVSTALMQIGTDLLNKAMPYLQQFAGWFTDNLPWIQSNVEQAFGYIVNTVLPPLTEAFNYIKDTVLPPVSQAFDWFIQNLPQLAPIITGVIAAIAGFSAAITVINAVKTAIEGFRMAQLLLNAAMSANPFMIVVGVITTLIGVFMTLWTTNEDFRNAVTEIWNGVCDFFSGIGETIGGIIDTIGGFFTDLGNGIGDVVNTIGGKFTELKDGAVNKFNEIKDGIGQKFNEAKDFLTNTAGQIKDGIGNAFENAKNTAGDIFDGIKNTLSDKFGLTETSLIDTAKGIGDGIRDKFNDAKNKAGEIFGSMKDTIGDKINGAKDVVNSGLDKIKGFFSGLKLEFPKIKLPHFSISGSFSFNPLSVPHLDISWYAKGGVFSEPTILASDGGLKGVGEAGPEAVAPIDVLQGYVRQAVGEKTAESEYLLSRIYSILADLLPAIAEAQGKPLVLDTGALVGGIAKPMDDALGNLARRRERGR